MALVSSPLVLPALLSLTLAAVITVAVWNLRLRRSLRASRRELTATADALRIQREEHAKAQAAAHASLESERELVELKSRFVSLVSHEFRTPLGIIMSAGELLSNYRDRLPPESQRELLQDILGSTRRMAALMEQVLLLGRAEAGRITVRALPMNLVAEIEQIIDEQRSTSAEPRPILLRTVGDLDDTRGDIGLVRHILANLVSNAVKYSPAGGEVRLLVRRCGGEAAIEVADSGIGIPETDLARLFEAFHRASNVGEIPGSGLGLLIVKRCVDLHGGRIDVRSRVGEGTTFEVHLPLFATPYPAVDEGDDSAAPRSIASRMIA